MSEDHKRALLSRVAQRQAGVAVVGLGYVGLPLATAIAAAGFPTVGIDLSKERVDSINAGCSHVEDVDSREVAGLVGSGRLRATTDSWAASDCDCAIIVVPTPIDEHRTPDITFVRGAAEGLARAMRPGSLVVLESTTYPGTTEEVVVPAFTAQGFTVGADLFVGYSPERIEPGNPIWNLANTPKVVSGMTDDCLEVVSGLYSSFVRSLVPVSSVRVAETTKLFENTFRIVNIGLVNEMQMICDAFGIDAWEVIGACSSKPFGFMPFYPGPGLGGHCVPVDPFYLAWKVRQKKMSAEFIELAGRVNAAMPRYTVQRIASLLNARGRALNGSRVALVGVAYKKNVRDVRESPALELIELLLETGADVSYHDPHVPVLALPQRTLASRSLTPDYLAAQDCTVVVTDHDQVDWSLVTGCSQAVLDTRNVLSRYREGPAPAPAPAFPRPAANGTGGHGRDDLEGALGESGERSVDEDLVPHLE